MAEYQLQIAKNLSLTVDEDGNLDGSISYYASLADFNESVSKYPQLRTGRRYKDILNPYGITTVDPYNLIITGIDCTPLDMWDGDIQLANITVTCSNRVRYVDTTKQQAYNFNISIQSEITTEMYRGNTFWESLNMALPETEKEFQIPYSIVTLSGTYRLAVPVNLINTQLNTVNNANWDLNQFAAGLGTVPKGCAKFVGFSYEAAYDNDYDNFVSNASFSFHIRGFDWNYKLRPAEIMKNAVTGEELYWQDQYSWLPTYVGNAVSGTALAGTPIWAGSNSVLGGDKRLSQNVFDKQLFPKAGETGIVLAYEYPYCEWSFL